MYKQIYYTYDTKSNIHFHLANFKWNFEMIDSQITLKHGLTLNGLPRYLKWNSQTLQPKMIANFESTTSSTLMGKRIDLLELNFMPEYNSKQIKRDFIYLAPFTKLYRKGKVSSTNCKCEKEKFRVTIIRLKTPKTSVLTII